MSDFDSAWARAIISYGNTVGVNFDYQCAGFDISEAFLNGTDSRVSNAFITALWERILLERNAFSASFGAASKISVFDFSGYMAAIVSAPSVRSAIKLHERYLPIVSHLFGVDSVLDGKIFTLRLRNNPDLHWANQLMFFALVAETSRQLLRRQAILHSLMLNFSDPGIGDILEQQLNTAVLFDSTNTEVILDNAELDIIRDGYNESLHLSQCQLLSDAYDALGSGFRVNVRDVVATLIESSSPVTVEDVAGKLLMSRRTLQRKLAEKGSSLSSIVDEVRLTNAKIFLITSALPLKMVGEKVGFETQASFTKFFSRCTGITPLKYRKAHLGNPPT
jgi:AraC-like DNA-binding protein